MTSSTLPETPLLNVLPDLPWPAGQDLASTGGGLDHPELAAFHQALLTDVRLRVYVEGRDLRDVAASHTRFAHAYRAVLIRAREGRPGDEALRTDALRDFAEARAGRIATAPDGSPYRAQDLAVVLGHLVLTSTPPGETAACSAGAEASTLGRAVLAGLAAAEALLAELAAASTHTGPGRS